MTTSPSRSFERIADSYDDTRGGEDRGRRFARELARLLDPRRPVLELGIGTGVVALGLQELGFRVLGLDLSPAMLERARQRIGPRVAAGDLRHLPVATGAVAQALCVWVLHVVGDVPATLAEIARILRPGGRSWSCPALPAIQMTKSTGSCGACTGSSIRAGHVATTRNVWRN